MVFSSIPAYLDPPNWQQNQNYQTGNSDLLHQLQQQQPVPIQPPAPPQPHGLGGAGSIRPGSMADRARMANIPMPETALKCPRCESTHTKFCYFNNYSLSQPRHFCKACRRYWTRGGALRSVPVGGGCRRNKRSSKGSSSSSKSEPANSETANSGSTNSALPSNPAATPTASILGGLTSQIPRLGNFMPPLSHLNPGNELGLNYSGITGPNVEATNEMNFQIGNNLFSTGSGDGGVSSLLSSTGGGGLEVWRMHHAPQFPNFLGGFDPSVESQGGVFYQSNYQAAGGVEGSGSGYVGAKLSSSSSMMSQLASVKMEATHNYINTSNNQDHDHSNLARQLKGSVQENEHQWTTVGAAAWTDLSGFSSSSTSNPL